MGKKKAGKRANQGADWRGKLKQLRAKRKQLGKKLAPAYARAKKQMVKLGKSAGEEASAVGAGLGAGWRQLRKTYATTRTRQAKKKAKARRA